MKYPLALGLMCAATTAHALQHPQPAIPLGQGGDPHIQVARYNPADPVLLVGAVGRPVTITFAPTEHVRSVNLDAGYVDAAGKAVSAPWDGPEAEKMKDAPSSILPLWAVRAGRSNAQIVTGTEDGGTRTYQFVLVALPPQPDDCFTARADQETVDCDDIRLAYGLSFTYPAERPKVDPIAIKAVAQKREAARKLASEERLKTDIFYGTRNWKYVAKGKPDAVKVLAPDQMSDNAAVTGLLYLGNRKAPSIYIVEADGTERQVTPTTDKDMLVVGETARHWRLRSGSQVADLYNQGYDPIGANPYTGTISPDVLRVTRDMAQK